MVVLNDPWHRTEGVNEVIFRRYTGMQLMYELSPTNVKTS